MRKRGINIIRQKSIDNMGNSETKPPLSGSDKTFLSEHTAASKEEITKHENFLLEHPDGQITPQEFR